MDTTAVEEEAGEKLKTRRIQHKHGRAKLPESLPRIPIEHDLKPEEKKCPCCGHGALPHRQGDQRATGIHPGQLQGPPAHPLQVRLRAECDGATATSRRSRSPTQARRSRSRRGCPVRACWPMSSPASWAIICRCTGWRTSSPATTCISPAARCAPGCWRRGELVQPLVDLMASGCGSRRVIHTDDTRVPVQMRPATGKCKSGASGPTSATGTIRTSSTTTPPTARAPGRASWLDKFKGYLQADAYGGYDGIYATGDVIEVACWAHARRQVLRRQGHRRPPQPPRCWRWCGELYAVEDEARRRRSPRPTDVTREQADAIRLALRQSRASRSWRRSRPGWTPSSKLVLPRSPMAGAITYTLNQWDGVVRLHHARLPEHRQQRRRAGDEAGGHRPKELALRRQRPAAGQRTPCSTRLIASAERHGIDPQALPHQRAGQDRPDAASANWISSCRTDGSRRTLRCDRPAAGHLAQ